MAARIDPGIDTLCLVECDGLLGCEGDLVERAAEVGS